MTNSPKRDYYPRWSPDGSKIAFLSDRDGKTQIWIINPFGGEAEKLTNSKTGVKSFKWFPDSKKIAYLATEPLTEEEERKKKEKDDAY
ncbi:S9 family peptidase, partial [SCandidatus Aminicenantes bacterium Aminicenantia_JdfR_composite]|nr:S9 family peptidase [SCandidatus Aminicenantes bacterium Aminicenantia_JdfR_composite]